MIHILASIQSVICYDHALLSCRNNDDHVLYHMGIITMGLCRNVYSKTSIPETSTVLKCLIPKCVSKMSTFTGIK